MPRSGAWKASPFDSWRVHRVPARSYADRRHHRREPSEPSAGARCVIARRSTSRTCWRCRDGIPRDAGVLTADPRAGNPTLGRCWRRRSCAKARPLASSTCGGARYNPFTDKQIALLKTFANQAVIAIENVRLFQELEARNRELSQALERETATGGILRAIATSPTDASSVFAAILENTLRLCGATIGSVNLSDGQQVSIAAIRGPAGLLDAVKSAFPRRLTDSGLATRVIREGVVVHVPELLEDPTSLREIDERSGMRAQLFVPMLRESRCIGALAIARDSPGLFSEAQVALMHTLADQAAIAVENVRLFQELQARNRELTESLEQQTATAEILRVIASSPTDLGRSWRPSPRTLPGCAGRRIRRSSVSKGSTCAWWRGMDHCAEHWRSATPSRQSRHRSGRVVRDRRTIHVEDILAAEAEFPITVSRVRQAGTPHPNNRWRHRCCARARRWASSSSIGDPRSIPSRPSRSRSSRRSPTRRSSRSRTCGSSGAGGPQPRLSDALGAADRAPAKSFGSSRALSTDLAPDHRDAVTRHAARLARADHALIDEATEASHPMAGGVWVPAVVRAGTHQPPAPERPGTSSTARRPRSRTWPS